MTPGARLAAVLAGMVLAVLALVAAMREIVIASDAGVHWPTSPALRRLTTDPSWATWVAAAVAAAVGVALIVLGVRQARRGGGGPEVIQFKDERGSARLDVGAVERGMRKRLQATLPGVHVARIELRQDGDAWRITVRADVPAHDLQALRARMQALAGEDLLRMGGMRLRRLDLVTGRLDGA